MQASISFHENTPADVDAPPYTDFEKAWLNTQWGGEFKFLRAHGLSIHTQVDREEGRRIARASIHQAMVDSLDLLNAQSGGA